MSPTGSEPREAAAHAVEVPVAARSRREAVPVQVRAEGDEGGAAEPRDATLAA